jgi:uncharacterized protein
MSRKDTLRILEIDGGGERGYLPLKFLELFIQQWGIDPSKIWQEFDVICGTSVGGIMALGLAFGLTPAQMTPFFITQGPYIFSLSSIIPSLRPNLPAKLALIATNTPFYQSSGPTAQNYGSGLLYKTVQDIFKINGIDATLQNLKTKVIIPAYEFDTKRYILFSNLNYPEFTGQNELISNVALATGAAPVYLPPLSMNSHFYKDGGIYCNNPTQFGKALAQTIKPTAKRVCILSLGTGIGEMGFDDDTNPNDPPPQISTVEEIFMLFSISSTGAQESIARAFFLESNYTLQQTYYYRFQPLLDPTKNTELDNTDSDILAYYEQTAQTVFNDDIDNISTFIGHLSI